MRKNNWLIGILRVFTTLSLVATLTKVFCWLVAPQGSFLDTWVDDGVQTASILAAAIAVCWVEWARANRLEEESKKEQQYNANYVQNLEKRIADFKSGNIDFKEAEDIYHKVLKQRVEKIRQNEDRSIRGDTTIG